MCLSRQREESAIFLEFCTISSDVEEEEEEEERKSQEKRTRPLSCVVIKLAPAAQV